MGNPYPASRMEEKIYVKSNNYYSGNNYIKIIDKESRKEIESGKEYAPKNLYLEFVSYGKVGICSFEYTALIRDDLEGLIEGKTCRLKFYTPKCLAMLFMQ